MIKVVWGQMFNTSAEEVFLFGPNKDNYVNAQHIHSIYSCPAECMRRRLLVQQRVGAARDVVWDVVWANAASRAFRVWCSSG